MPTATHDYQHDPTSCLCAQCGRTLTASAHRQPAVPRDLSAEDRAWAKAGDLLLDDPREGDEWGLAREALAFELLAVDERRDAIIGAATDVATASTLGISAAELHDKAMALAAQTGRLLLSES